MTFFLLYHVQKVTRNYGGKCYEIKYYRTRKISIVIAVNTQSVMLLVEQKASTMLCPRTLFDATSAVFQERLNIFISSSVDLLYVLTGLPAFLLPCGLHFKACLVVLVGCFRGLSKTVSVLPQWNLALRPPR